MIDRARLLAAYETARRELLAQRSAEGHWVGELSTSGLSTATAVSALAAFERARAEGHPPGRSAAPCATSGLRPFITGGVRWLIRHQNADGGWGDTDKSHSNIAATMLAAAALHLAGEAASCGAQLEQADRYLDREGRVAGLRRRYGKDKTFAVPILSNCALAGLESWSDVAPLPFELACLPQQVYRFLRLPVVSYAIPALVAIGQARYHHQRPLNPLIAWVRSAAVGKSLRVLERMQPASGGYLEATPLTSFVVMNLAGSGLADHPVVGRGVEFLRHSVRPDGGWPIDTNLAAWNTTLSLNALAAGGEDLAQFTCLDWLLSCQHRQKHPFTGARPGGWGWTDLSGAVPDADDTAGALLALAAWRDSPGLSNRDGSRIHEAAAAAATWLLDLQNSDGGWPTFCRGWGKLPFDRSGADLTAHALRALHRWRGQFPDQTKRVQAACARGLKQLERSQHPDGSWTPLWFGNQDHPREENPVYGTAKVLLAYYALGLGETTTARRAFDWLRAAQREDGGWGVAGAGLSEGKMLRSSVEETALAVEAILEAGQDDLSQTTLFKGLQWILQAVESSAYLENTPIGFYFAKLWYYEKLYPLIFTVSALGRARRRCFVSCELHPAAARQPDA